MKGSYRVIIGNKKVTYDLTLNRQVTIIKGNSATGKTTLFSMFRDACDKNFNTLGIKCNCRDKLFAITSINRDLDYIKNLHNKIIIADEDITFIQTTEFADIVNNSDNYFIFITRSGRMKYLTYSVNEIYELCTTNSDDGENITKLYQRYLDTPKTISPDLIVTEDSNSGHDMFELALNEFTVEPGWGRDNIYNVLMQNKFNYAYIIVDGAAFGSSIGRIYPKLRDKVSIFAPESFEFLLLSNDSFSKYLSDELVNTSECCDSTQFISWEGYYTDLLSRLCDEKYGFNYSKSKLNNFFKSKTFIDYIRNTIPDKLIKKE